MQWSDEGVILSVRAHGETAAIAEVFTRENGRHLGLVHGGRSRRMRPVLQMGNHIEATWKARLADHLGGFRVELRTGYAASVLDNPAALAGLMSLATLLRLLPERDPHPSLFEVTLFVLEQMQDVAVWPALMVRWELALLEEFGFGLDLATCAVTGSTENLVFVSPKSGRAVCAEAAAPYADKLLALPGFLVAGGGRSLAGNDLIDGLRLTGYFLEHRVLAPRDLMMPEPRERMIAALQV